MATPANTASFELLGEPLACDVEQSLFETLAAGVVFAAGTDPLSIFRHTLAESIRDIEDYERGQLLQRFLREGPYENGEEIPKELVSNRLSDGETAASISFIFGFMVNSFKGALMEILACAPCLRLMRSLQEQECLSGSERLYVGDSVLAAKLRGSGLAKGADLHILTVEKEEGEVTVAGVVEVKSYRLSQRRIRRQLDQHLLRAALGLVVGGKDVPRQQIRVGRGRQRRSVRIAVLPSSWKLPRKVKFKEIEGRRSLAVEYPEPSGQDQIVATGADEWRITLRWSQEAIASAAYEMTFWYMKKVGEVIYRGGVPAEWSEMTPAEAGRYAVKMMLYYSILRCRTAREEERAIALYNTYGFGYALGMSFRDGRKGRREMLWPQDLDEIARNGKTEKGNRFW